MYSRGQVLTRDFNTLRSLIVQSPPPGRVRRLIDGRMRTAGARARAAAGTYLLRSTCTQHKS